MSIFSAIKKSDAVNALIGAQAGIVAIWCTIPLEKMQQKSATEKDENGKPLPYTQLFQQILRKHGITSFWTGVDILTLSVSLEKGGYFFFYSVLKAAIQPESMFANLMVGYTAELCRVPIVYPIETIASIMMTRNMSAGSAMQTLMDDGGLPRFWKGAQFFFALAFRSGITQAIFDKIKDYMLKGRGGVLSLFEGFIFGAFASVIARVITYPIFRATIMAKSGQAGDKSIGEIMQGMYKEGGITGFYIGCGPELLRGVTFQGIMMAAMEVLEIPNKRYFGTLTAA